MKIVVLLDARQKGARGGPYILWPVCDAWGEAGHRVAWETQPRALDDADLVVPHVDLTFRPAGIRAALAGRPAVVNRDAVDVSKRRVSGPGVEPGDPWEGPVIVKTDLNHGGVPERRIRHGRLADLAFRLGLFDRGPDGRLGRARWLRPAAYPIFASLDAVPREVFANPALVVERFLPERDGRHYALRSWVFLASAGYNSRSLSPYPIVKARDVVRHEDGGPVPPEIAAARDRLGLDYGKIDYVVSAGGPVLLDANPTPTFAGTERTPTQRRRAAQLAEGLSAWES